MSEERFATAFREAAQEYERGRPGYPTEAIDLLGSELRLERGSAVVDLAAGTGKLTRALTARFHRVIAVEPLAEMRRYLARTAPAAAVLEGAAERLPLPAASVDAVFVAQAFHWFDGRRALTEIARVLRARGGLALMWNTAPWELRQGDWWARLDDLLERSRADLSLMRRQGTGLWREAFREEERFSPLSEKTFDNTQRMSQDEFLANLASRSYIARLDSEGRREVIGEIRELLACPDAPKEGEGAVVVPMRTDLYWAELRSGQGAGRPRS